MVVDTAGKKARNRLLAAAGFGSVGVQGLEPRTSWV